MATIETLWKSEESIRVHHPKGKDYLLYSGVLSVTNKKTKNITLEIKCIFGSYVLENIMKNEITFTGNSISEVYGKMSKYFSKYGLIFVN